MMKDSMQRVEVDARGLECPKPVIFTRKALEEHSGAMITTVVDSEIARDNVLKFCRSQGLEAVVTERMGTWYIDVFKKSMESGMDPMLERAPDFLDMVVLVGSNQFGVGERELGDILIKGYFYTLTESKPYPKSVLFVNSGAYLTLEDSTVLEYVRTLESEGVQILTCGTCLDYYHVKDKLAVGGVTNMYTIVEMMNGARNTVRI
jgi:selenium metabolism protein YedF